MGPKRAATATLAIALLVTVASALLLLRRGSEQLKYQGRPIEHWFAQLPVTAVVSQGVVWVETVTVLGQQYGNTGSVSQCFAALDAFGTNAIPYYLWKLQNSDSFLEQKAFQLAVQNSVRTVPFRNAAMERGQAVTALIHVKELAPDTLQTLFQISTNAQSDIAGAARFVLANGEQQVTGGKGQSVLARKDPGNKIQRAKAITILFAEIPTRDNTNQHELDHGGHRPNDE